MNERSQTESKITYALGEKELFNTINEIHQSGCFVDWVGSRDALDNIGRFHEECRFKVMTKEQYSKNFEIEQHAFDVWGL